MSHGAERGSTLSKAAIWLLIMIFPIASLAGISSLIKTGKPISKRELLSVFLNSGLCGVAIASLMIHRFGDEAMALIIGVSILAGLGGNYTIDVIVGITMNVIKGIGERLK